MTFAAHRWMFTAPGAPLQRADFVAHPGAGEVVVAVAGCGVCHTDLGYYYDGVRTNQPLPLALGHEISGRVVTAGAGAEAWLGRAVIVPAVLPCGECDLCRRGLTTICRSQKMPGNDIQGGFGTHIVVPARGLCPVDEQRLAKAGLTLAQVSIVKPTTDSVAPWTSSPQAVVWPAAMPEHSNTNHSVDRRPFDFAKAEIAALSDLGSCSRTLSVSDAPCAPIAASLAGSTSIATTVAPNARATWTQ